jgi:hypothetical protein
MMSVYIFVLMGAFQSVDASFRRKHQATPLVPAADAKAQSNASFAITLNEVAKHELHELLQVFVQEALHVEPLDAFKPKCLEHVKKLIGSVDQSYTDEQLETALQNECKLAQEFPKSVKSGYKSHDKCMEFAKKLAAARNEELKSGDASAYDKFCAEYHKHLENDPVVEPKPPAPVAVNSTNTSNCSQTKTAPVSAPKSPKKAEPKKEEPSKKSYAHGSGAFILLPTAMVAAFFA